MRTFNRRFHSSLELPVPGSTTVDSYEGLRPPISFSDLFSLDLRVEL